MQRDFDRLGRLLTIDYNSPTTTPKVTFSYDNAGNRVLMNENNGTSDIRKTNYAYDDLHRLASVGFDNDGNGTVDDHIQRNHLFPSHLLTSTRVVMDVDWRLSRQAIYTQPYRH